MNVIQLEIYTVDINKYINKKIYTVLCVYIYIYIFAVCRERDTDRREIKNKILKI